MPALAGSQGRIKAPQLKCQQEQMKSIPLLPLQLPVRVEFLTIFGAPCTYRCSQFWNLMVSVPDIKLSLSGITSQARLENSHYPSAYSAFFQRHQRAFPHGCLFRVAHKHYNDVSLAAPLRGYIPPCPLYRWGIEAETLVQGHPGRNKTQFS